MAGNYREIRSGVGKSYTDLVKVIMKMMENHSSSNLCPWKS